MTSKNSKKLFKYIEKLWVKVSELIMKKKIKKKLTKKGRSNSNLQKPRNFIRIN